MCDLGGERRVALLQGQRRSQHAGVADLSPVVAGFDPAGVFERGAQTLFHEGGGQGVAGGGVEIVIQPIVADGQREGHFGHVEKVRGVPVGEGGGGQHLGGAAVAVGGIAAEAVGHGEGGDAVKDAARDAEQTTPFHLARVGRQGEHLVGIVQQATERGAREGVGGGAFFQRGEAGGVGEQARVGGRRLAQRGGDGVRRRGVRALREQRSGGAGEEEKGKHAGRAAEMEQRGNGTLDAERRTANAEGMDENGGTHVDSFGVIGARRPALNL